jgi:hypothetical protein
MNEENHPDAQAWYAFGHAAAANPAHRDRSFEEIEADLQKEWAEDVISRHGDWATARPHAREGFVHGTVSRGGA